MYIYLAVLFFLSLPGVLFTLPSNGSKLTVALTHTLLFTTLSLLVDKLYKKDNEGFRGISPNNGKTILYVIGIIVLVIFLLTLFYMSSSGGSSGLSFLSGFQII